MKLKTYFMKCYPKTFLLCTMLIVVTAIFSGCEEKDYYDPNFKTDNPLGDISAPAGFDWKTTRSVPVTVKVNDEMSDQYYYLVEVFEENPLSNPDAGLLAKGVAKESQDFLSGITVASGVELVYVKQTDPKGRVRIMTASTEADINCTFGPNYLPEKITRAATRAAIELPTYSEDDEDYKTATEWTGGGFSNNTNYKISAGNTVETNKITLGGSSGKKLYIAGTWKAKSTVSIASGVELIILEDGKVEFEELASSKGASNVVIMEGGVMNITGSKGAMIGASNSFYNFGTLNIPNGKLDAQNGDGSIFFIGSDAVVNAQEMQIHNDKTYIENHGHIKVERWVNGGGAAIIHNMCVIEATESIEFTDIAQLYMDGGTVVAPLITLSTPKVILKNGSMFKCDKLVMEGDREFAGEGGGNRSLIKIGEITGKNVITISGHVTLECSKYNENRVKTDKVADIAPYSNSNVVIEGCKIEGNPGNEGEDPKDPEFPIVIPVKTTYTYLFEDNWPLYGDYDMNDVVFRFDNIKTVLSSENAASSFSFDVTFLASGAEKRIAGALMLDAIDASAIASVSYSATAKTDKFETSSAGVELGQSKAVIPLFSSIHEALGKPTAWFINTIEDGPRAQDNVDPVKINVEIKFVKPVFPLDLNINKLNFFIITDINKFPITSNARREVHMVGFAPTQKADVELFGYHNDNSSSPAYYISKENLAWGIVVPAEFNWMIEENDIQFGYLDFAGWVKSGGTQNDKWWLTNRDTEKIYGVN